MPNYSTRIRAAPSSEGTAEDQESEPRSALDHDEKSNVKIVYLNPTGQLGGAERVLLDLLASLRAAQPDWSTKLIVASEGPLSERALTLGVPTTVLPFPPSIARLGDSGAGGPAALQLRRLILLSRLGLAIVAAASYVGELRRVLVQMAPDILQTNGFKMHVLGVWARPSQVPVIWHIHDYVRPRPIMRSEEHTSELQSRQYLVCRLLLEKKKETVARRTARCR